MKKGGHMRLVPIRAKEKHESGPDSAVIPNLLPRGSCKQEATACRAYIHQLILQKHNGVRVANRCLEEALGIVRVPRGDDLRVMNRERISKRQNAYRSGERFLPGIEHGSSANTASVFHTYRAPCEQGIYTQHGR